LCYSYTKSDIKQFCIEEEEEEKEEESISKHQHDCNNTTPGFRTEVLRRAFRKMQDHTSGHHRITAKPGKATKNNETGNCCKAVWPIINRRSRWFTDLYTLNTKIVNSNHFHGSCVCCCVRWNTEMVRSATQRILLNMQ
jgi:hypothetical protein